MNCQIVFSSSPEEISEAITNCHRITWDIQIYASQGEIKAEKRISVWSRHDSTFYPLWKRLCLLVCDLEWVVCYWDGQKEQPLPMGSASQNKLKVNDNKIEFNGGFLKLKDPGLKIPLECLGIQIPDVVKSHFESQCDPFVYEPKTLLTVLKEAGVLTLDPAIEERKDLQSIFNNAKISFPRNSNAAKTRAEGLFPEIRHIVPFGRTIHIEAEFEDNGSHDKQPLFFFPQNDYSQVSDHLADAPTEKADLGNIFLAVGESNLADLSGARKLFWTISNNEIVSDPFDLGSVEVKHMVSVSQDSNWIANALNADVTSPYFEMMVDTIGLGDETRRMVWGLSSLWKPNPKHDAEFLEDLKSDHEFGSGERTFYVGFVPSDPHERLPGWTGEVFFGKLYRLVFDPNSSCSMC